MARRTPKPTKSQGKASPPLCNKPTCPANRLVVARMVENACPEENLNRGNDRRSGDGGGADICIIRAGSAGLVAAKVLDRRASHSTASRRAPILVACGVTRMTTAFLPPYRSVKNLAYSDFPFPPGSPDFPSHRDVLNYFVGLVQTIGPTIPLVERQADAMERAIDRHHAALTRRFVGSPRSSGPMCESSPRIAGSGVLAHDSHVMGGGGA